MGAALFCTDCGQPLPSPDAPCPACPQLDERRRVIVDRYRGQLAELRQIDAEENARALRDAAGAARALVPPVQARTGPLEQAVSDTIAAERAAADRARGARRYLQKVTRAEGKARRDNASPETLTEAVMRRKAAAEVLADVDAAAAAAAGARQHAEAELTAHLARLAVLEDAAVAAERDAASPPPHVPPSMWTALLAHPLQVLLAPGLDDTSRALVGVQISTLARLAGVADELRAQGRAELEAEQADRTRHPAQLQNLGDGNIGVTPNPLHPGTPRPFDPPAPGSRPQAFVPPAFPHLGS